MRALTLREQTISGLGWTTFASLARQAIGLSVLLVLARLLDPTDFGLIAMVTVLTAFVGLVPQLGLGPALVQAPELDDVQCSSAWWLCLLVGVLLAGAVAIAAPSVGIFYGDSRLVALTHWLAPGLLLEAVAVVPAARLQRAMAFRQIARVELTAAAGGGIAGLFAAFAGFGATSLAFQLLASSAIHCVGSHAAAHWRPRGRPRADALRPLLRFGGSLLGFQLFNYWTRNADNFLIGRFVGAGALGYYGMAYRLMMMPLQQVTQVFQRVMFPALSRVQDDPARVKAAYLRATRLVGLVTIPAVCGLFVVAPSLVAVVLGPEWQPVVPLLQVLCLVAVKQPLGATMGWIYQSQGRTDLMLRWGLVVGAVTIAGFAVGLRWGALGVAASYAVTRYLVWVPAVRIPGRLIGLGFGEFVRNVAGIFGCSVAMAGFVWLLGESLPTATPEALGLGIQVLAGAAAFAALASAFDLEAWRDAQALIAERIRGTRPEPLPSRSGL
jgi:PST family polysaccharide transporter